ncbi:MFS transporter [Acidimicrobiia bacterium EGI L10123]|uniref:MFS transporter n=1 Tax=Salinilacustrithrix flava TaxID=2957203 RepID=UPI003D7C3213|nr:MFS transporter [Acidimicrobiia bacterium EGI L10123]
MGAHLRIDPKLPAPFQRLRAAAWASNFGDGVRNAALPLIAAGLDGSATTVAVVAAAGTLPFAVLGLPAGTMADRRRRVPLIVSAHLFRFVVMAGLAAVILLDATTVGVLVGAAFLLGCGEAVADSASPALLPDLVDDDRLEEANGELETAELVANDLVGPSIGGTLTALSSSLPFVVDAASFLAAGALVRTVDVDESHTHDPPASTWWADLREGARTSWTNPVLRSTGALIVLLQLGSIAAIAPIVIYLTERLDLSPTGYGIFLSIGSLGGLAGARSVKRLVKRRQPFHVLLASLALTVVAFLLMAVPSLPVVTVGFALSFAAVVTGRIIVIAARQRSVPGRLLGRAQGTIRSLLWTAATVGALLGGAISDGIGVQAPFLFAAAVTALATVLIGPSLRRVL